MVWYGIVWYGMVYSRLRQVEPWTYRHRYGYGYGVDKDIDSKKLEHGCWMIHAGLPSSFGLGLEDGHVPTFWLLLYLPRSSKTCSSSNGP